ncbi:MAG TPA: hypothetical protein DCS13_00130 [Candidatus Margulisbacteria bacterium]|nr:MAG: hypothetical protein A2X43_04655 [Candidatus Margulisbacteria bacterium GWD2_39_127]OGI01566.1 MAG: hypothetical protein A2X42_08295 [Candidatus Margulisbacteria bacterium GWF2_38_17]HAR61850.1 hypothetical protein [Candidatus Margulisiibacteriota bacterium]
MLIRLIAVCLINSLLFCYTAQATQPKLPYKEGEVIVKLKQAAIAPEQLLHVLDGNLSQMAIKQDKHVGIKKIIKRQNTQSMRVTSYKSFESKLRLLEILSHFERYYLVTFNAEIPVLQVVEQLKKTNLTEFAEPNYYVHLSSQPVPIPNDPYFNFTDKYDLFGLNISAAWDIASAQGSPIVAVIDTGVDYNHPDLAANMWADGEGNHGYDPYYNDYDPMDYDGHGTHVSGIIAAVCNNGIGGVGVATNAKIMAIKMFTDLIVEYGTWVVNGGTSDMLVSAIQFAISNHADVINMSIGSRFFWSEEENVIRDACNQASAAGIVLVAAAGNDGGDGELADYEYPSAVPAVISVGALNQDLITRADFSNYGSSLDLVAPGSRIFSALTHLYGTNGYTPYIGSDTPVVADNAKYMHLSGTSQATPIVAGLAALMKQTNPDLTGAQIRSIMEQTADDLGTPHWDKYFGNGRINPVRALIAADTVKPTVTESSVTYFLPLNPIIITANIVDNISPVMTENITTVLFWKTASENTYKQEVMSRVSAGSPLFQAIVPALDIETSLNYFIVVCDLNPANVVTGPVRTVYTYDIDPPAVTMKNPSIMSAGRYLLLTVVEISSIVDMSITINNSLGQVVATGSISSGTVTHSGGFYQFLLPLSMPAGHYSIYVGAIDGKNNLLPQTLIGSVRISDDLVLLGPTAQSSEAVVYPSPFNPAKDQTADYLRVGFRLTKQADSVEMSVFDLNGNKIGQGCLRQGFPIVADLYYELTWDGRDDSGSYAKNGVYLGVIKVVCNGKKLINKVKISVLR